MVAFQVKAFYDGEVLRLKEPIELEPNTDVLVTISEMQATPKLGEPYSSLDLLASLNLEGPSDWSERLEDYFEGFSEDDTSVS